VVCKTADATNSDREATPCGWLFVCPHLFISASPGGPNPRRGSNPSSQEEFELYCLLYSLDGRSTDQRFVLLDRVKPQGGSWAAELSMAIEGRPSVLGCGNGPCRTSKAFTH
jgi:hypothetical protein